MTGTTGEGCQADRVNTEGSAVMLEQEEVTELQVREDNKMWNGKDTTH